MNTIEFARDETMSFWPTPPEVSDSIVYNVLDPWHGDGGPAPDGSPAVRVLEPSAGEGHLLYAVRKHLPLAHVTAVEPAAARTARLREQTGLADVVIESTLEDYLAGVAFEAMGADWRPYDLIFANPPFTLPDRPEAWAEHIIALAQTPNLIGPCGIISAVVPRIVLTGKSPLVRKVRSLLSPYGGMEPCERGAFAPVGAGVSAALIWMQPAWRD